VVNSRIKRKHTIVVQWVLLPILLFSGFYYVRIVLPAASQKTGGPFRDDLYPTWYAVHAVIKMGRSPYTADATRDIQAAIYGTPLAETSALNQHRFAYPLFAIFPAAPLALVNFGAAQELCLWGGIALAIATTWLWCRCLEQNFTVGICAAVLASPMVGVAILLRQPSVLYIFLLAAAVYLFKSGHYFMGGAIGAVASAKPQLALFVVGFLLIVTLREWKERKAFVAGYALTISALLGLSFALQPGWFRQWLDTVRAYRDYGSVFQFYNGLLLVPVYLWLWKSRTAILNGPLYVRLFFQVPTVILAAAYFCVILSCVFSTNLFVIVTPILFFSLAAHALAIETPAIAFYILRSAEKTGTTTGVPMNYIAITGRH
jgi:Glycosyltransferase family 87